MFHTKEITRPDGTKLQLTVSFTIIDGGVDQPRMTVKPMRNNYSFFVKVWKNASYEFPFDIFKPPFSDVDIHQRDKMILDWNLNYVTKDEVNRAYLELWDMMKPKLL